MTTAPPVRVALDDVHVRLGDRDVLRGVDLHLAERRVAVIGANGSGKSTLARLLDGLVLPTRGTVRVDGLCTRRDGRAVRRRVGLVLPDPDAQILLPTPAEDVACTLRPHRLPRAEVRARVAEALDRFGLAEHADRPAHVLSGGQKQLLALASVLVGRPALVVADEPTARLDLRHARRVAEALDALEQTVVLVTHDLDLAARYERVLVVDDGRVVVDDAPGPAVAAYRALQAA